MAQAERDAEEAALGMGVEEPPLPWVRGYGSSGPSERVRFAT